MLNIIIKVVILAIIVGIILFVFLLNKIIKLDKKFKENQDLDNGELKK